MSLHIIIDGYNLIRQSAEWSSLDIRDIQLGREALLERLAAYRKIRHHQLTVVFDGAHSLPGTSIRETIRGIRIRYSRAGELADDVIKRMAEVERERALVVTSDLDVARFARNSGCATIESRLFEEKLAMAMVSDKITDNDEKEAGWIPTTRKKGPSRKLSRKDRRNRIKTGKL